MLVICQTEQGGGGYITKIAVYNAQSSSNSSNSDMGVHECLHKLGLVMGQHIDIIAIYRQHRYYCAFPRQTATRGCFCVYSEDPYCIRRRDEWGRLREVRDEEDGDGMEIWKTNGLH